MSDEHMHRHYSREEDFLAEFYNLASAAAAAVGDEWYPKADSDDEVRKRRWNNAAPTRRGALPASSCRFPVRPAAGARGPSGSPRLRSRRLRPRSPPRPRRCRTVDDRTFATRIIGLPYPREIPTIDVWPGPVLLPCLATWAPECSSVSCASPAPTSPLASARPPGSP